MRYVLVLMTGRMYRSALDLWLGEVLCIKGIPIPYGAPNAATHIERIMGSLKRECSNHFIFLSEDHLRRTVVAYISYYNRGRPHQGIDGIPECGPGLPRSRPVGPMPDPTGVTSGVSMPPRDTGHAPRIRTDEVFAEHGREDPSTPLCPFTFERTSR